MCLLNSCFSAVRAYTKVIGYAYNIKPMNSFSIVFKTGLPATSSRGLIRTALFILIFSASAQIMAELNWRQNLPVSEDQSVLILKNRGYFTGYSECRRSALWVSYPLAKKRYSRWPKKRPEFREDSRTRSNLSAEDYRYSGYDRGHLAPGYAVWAVSGAKARTQTYLMSNIVPQKSRLNQKLWQRLEEAASTYFPRYFSSITVYSGPVFMSFSFTDSGVRIPDALYKIYIGENSGKLFALSFIMPQTVKGNESLMHFVSSIDEIELLTGLDFLSLLPDSIESPLEAKISTGAWNLTAVADLPARY